MASEEDTERTPLLENTENTPLLGEPSKNRETGEEEGVAPQHTVTRHARRWDLLCLLSVMGLLQNIVWNTWGPLAITTSWLYDWGPDTVSLLANHGPTMYLVMLFPVALLVRKSLRTGLLLTSGCITLGTFLRASFMPSAGADPTVFLITCHLCSLLNGVATTVLGSGTLVLAFLWFPPEELGTALTISQIFFSLGPGLPFLMAAQMVEPLDGLSKLDNTNRSSGDPSPNDLSDITNDLQWYLYSQAIPAAILFIFIVIYFPSGSSRDQRQSLRDKAAQVTGQVRVLVTSGRAWLICLGSALPQGITRAWLAVCVFSLTQVCIAGECLTQHWVDTMAILACIASVLAGMAAIRLIALSTRHLQVTITFLYIGSCITFTCLSLVLNKQLPTLVLDPQLPSSSLVKTQISVLFLFVTGYSLVVSSVPLTLKVATDSLPSVHPSLVGCWVNLWTNLASLLLLSILSTPHMATNLAHIALPVSSGLGIAFFLPLLSPALQIL